MKTKFNNIKFSNYINLIVGCFIAALSFNLFWEPYNIVAGGVAGTSIMTEHLFGIDPFIFMICANVVLLILSYFLLGPKMTAASILGTLLFPLTIKLTSYLVPYIDLQIDDMFFISILAGIFTGLGLGLIFKSGFSTGGTDILNQIVSKYTKVSIGRAMLVTDGIIVLSSAFVFGITNALYAIIVLYIISLMADKVMLGISDSKAFFIVTSKHEEVKDYITNTLHKGATVIDTTGAYSMNSNKMIMCIIATTDYFRLKEAINSIDDHAFFLVTDSYEVSGSYIKSNSN